MGGTKGLATVAVLLFAAALISILASVAEAQQNEHRVTLREIMSELGTEYLRATNALMTDDFKELEESSRAIQGHPLPVEIVTAIKSKLGNNFRLFEQVDEQSHHFAGDLAEHALARNGVAAAKAFGSLAESCVSCHEQFRALLRPLSDEQPR